MTREPGSLRVASSTLPEIESYGAFTHCSTKTYTHLVLLGQTGGGHKCDARVTELAAAGSYRHNGHTAFAQSLVPFDRGAVVLSIECGHGHNMQTRSSEGDYEGLRVVLFTY